MESVNLSRRARQTRYGKAVFVKSVVPGWNTVFTTIVSWAVSYTHLGRADVCWLDDEWTVVTMDGSLSAHYENTILITDGEPEILTLTEY